MWEVDYFKSFIKAMEETRNIIEEQDEWSKSHSITNDYGCDNSEYHWLKVVSSSLGSLKEEYKC